MRKMHHREYKLVRSKGGKNCCLDLVIGEHNELY